MSECHPLASVKAQGIAGWEPEVLEALTSVSRLRKKKLHSRRSATVSIISRVSTLPLNQFPLL